MLSQHSRDIPIFSREKDNQKLGFGTPYERSKYQREDDKQNKKSQDSDESNKKSFELHKPIEKKSMDINQSETPKKTYNQEQSRIDSSQKYTDDLDRYNEYDFYTDLNYYKMFDRNRTILEVEEIVVPKQWNQRENFKQSIGEEGSRDQNQRFQQHNQSQQQKNQSNKDEEKINKKNDEQQNKNEKSNIDFDKKQKQQTDSETSEDIFGKGRKDDAGTLL
ncbi:UNKNOWN [Stylonychia lemnae]|uniref:Uncharacterized protein n=1 Tax=Stylonychia lemnae TaxID=5949 RepID=A0A078ASD7_STYLE|nr:UNKNOWN [Stylonychia lemnae]|eukprot:CDW85099.1 UNKNOWN [Stylonychia lemnae]